MHFVDKKINFNKKETESKMENPTHSFRETRLVLRLKEESQIKSKTEMSCSSRKKKRVHFLYRLFCPKEIFFNICFLPQCIHNVYLNVLNTLSEYTYFYISKKHYVIYFFACFSNRQKPSILKAIQ